MKNETIMSNLSKQNLKKKEVFFKGVADLVISVYWNYMKKIILRDLLAKYLISIILKLHNLKIM